MECTTFNKIIQIISAIGSIATVGTFIYLFRRDKDKQAQIDALNKLWQTEENKLKFSYKPNIWINVTKLLPEIGELHFDLNNRGEEAKLLELVLTSNDFELHSEALPYDLQKDKSRYVYLKKTNDKLFDNCKFDIVLIYKDRIETRYSTKIIGIGSKLEIVETIEIK